jgi:aspartate/methionine/tyrosine aminotransferase
MLRPRGSKKAAQFTESVIREMTRLAHQHGAVNLSQGFPDFAAPDEVKEAACAAIRADINQYAVTWGARPLREAIAAQFTARHRVGIDADAQVTVCCGATETMMAVLLASVDPGDEVVVFEPFYENYGPDAIVSGAVPRYVTLQEPDWTFDPDELAAAFGPRTRAIIINTPNNPTGKVFTRAELTTIARLCQQWDVLAITDEIYEHIVYDGHQHVPMATIEGMADRTITINGLSKTFSVTGWRIGWAISPPTLTGAIRKMHDFLTVGAPAPLQEAGAAALSLPGDYYRELAARYQQRRDVMIEMLTRHGFRCHVPSGAYYVMTDIAHFGFQDDVAFAKHLVESVGVASVPGSSFYRSGSRGTTKVRFCFSKRDETMAEADRRLAKLRT